MRGVCGCVCVALGLTAHSSPHLLVDRDDRVVGVLAGRPQDPSWDETTQEATRAMCEAYASCRFKKTNVKHRRGEFATLARGVSFGGGRTVRTTMARGRRSYAYTSPSGARKRIQHRAQRARPVGVVQ